MFDKSKSRRKVRGKMARYTMNDINVEVGEVIQVL